MLPHAMSIEMVSVAIIILRTWQRITVTEIESAGSRQIGFSLPSVRRMLKQSDERWIRHSSMSVSVFRDGVHWGDRVLALVALIINKCTN